MTDKLQHTPGPWNAEDDSVFDSEGNFLSAFDGRYDATYLRDCANATLTSAAPEMLAALEKAKAQFQFYADEHTKAGKTEKAATNQSFANMCDAVICKAKGVPVPASVEEGK